jgi:hypothetical protein
MRCKEMREEGAMRGKNGEGEPEGSRLGGLSVFGMMAAQLYVQVRHARSELQLTAMSP